MIAVCTKRNAAMSYRANEKEQINVRADSRMLAKLDRLAQRYGVSRQNVLRMLVAEAGE